MKSNDDTSINAAAAKKNLIDLLRKKKLEENNGIIPIISENVAHPLSAAQARLWFLEHLNKNTPQYNVCSALRIPFHLEYSELEIAINTLIQRHVVLRIFIEERDGEPYQKIIKYPIPPIILHDLQSYAYKDATEKGMQLASEEIRLPFNLNNAPLFRINLVLLPRHESLLVLTFHHIIIDGWSTSIFFKELLALLSGEVLAMKSGIDFLDYLAWEKTNESSRHFSQQLNYWQNKLDGELPILDLPKDRSRPTNGNREGRLLQFNISYPITLKLKSFSDTLRVTLFTTLLAAYKVLLFRLTGQKDLIVGVPFSGRHHHCTENLLGCFVNTIAMRTIIDGSYDFIEIIKHVSLTVFEAFDNQSIPFDKIVETLRIPRDLQYTPVFQTLFALQNLPPYPMQIRGHKTEELLLDTQTAKFDLTISLTEGAEGIVGLAEYSTALFDEITVQNIADMFVKLIEGLITDPYLPIKRQALLTDTENKLLLSQMNRPVEWTTTYQHLAQPFEEQVEKTPNAIALIGEEGQLTYKELNEQANQIAHFLSAKKLENGDKVALFMERSFAMVIVLYAIAKAGAAYVPIDPEFPTERIKFMVENSNAKLLMTHLNVNQKLIPDKCEVICVDKFKKEWCRLPTTNLIRQNDPNALAYLLYTSGSTGVPKAVAYPINASVAFMLWMQKYFTIDESDSVLFKTPYGFDVSVWEIFWPLYNGSKLVVSRPGGQRDTVYLHDLISIYNITVVNFVPSMLQAFLEAENPDRCQSLRWILCGGESLSARIRDLCHSRTNAKLVNLYGPSEAGTVTYHIFDRNDTASTVPLGKPTAGYRLYILDDDLNIQPIGIPGELYIGADVGLAHGYHGQVELTAERFVPDPFNTKFGARLYKSGDICRYLRNGNLEHLGRIGTQIKLRGMRIELSEIESVFCKHASIVNCVVILVGQPDQQKLVAFVIQKIGSIIPSEELIQFAFQYLPKYMVPSSIINIKSIPTTINGKIDQKALIQCMDDSLEKNIPLLNLPTTVAEIALARIFKYLLGVSNISVKDSFFDLGGHSLLVLKLISACEQTFGIRLSVSQIFNTPSVEGLSLLLQDTKNRINTSLVPLAVDSSKPLLILVHASSGSIFPYVEITQHLRNDFSIYGLESPGLYDDAKPLCSISELAAHYVAITNALICKRPVLIAGWSFGGNIAIEMAREWQKRGTNIAGTFLIDSWAQPEKDVIKNVEEEVKKSLSFLQEANLIPGDMPTIMLNRMLRVLKSNLLAFHSHVPNKLNGNVVVLRAKENFPTSTESVSPIYNSPDQGWRKYVDKVVVHEIEGHHFNLLVGKHAKSLALTLRNIALDNMQNLSTN